MSERAYRICIAVLTAMIFVYSLYLSYHVGFLNGELSELRWRQHHCK